MEVRLAGVGLFHQFLVKSHHGQLAEVAPTLVADTRVQELVPELFMLHYNALH
jgi:hypothetical protein